MAVTHFYRSGKQITYASLLRTSLEELGQPKRRWLGGKGAASQAQEPELDSQHPRQKATCGIMHLDPVLEYGNRKLGALWPASLTSQQVSGSVTDPVSKIRCRATEEVI